MAQDETSIYNLALNAVGSRNNITIPTERSREAETCRLWYELVRDAAMASAPWPSALGTSQLALLSENDSDIYVAGGPKPNYQYAYAAPSDMLRPRYLASYNPFELVSFANNQSAIVCNELMPVLIYTKRLTNISLWDAQLQMAIVYALAGHICMPLSGKQQRAAGLIQQANALIMAAREGGANTDDQMLESIPDWLAARGYCSSVTPKFIYPNGLTFNLGALPSGAPGLFNGQ